MFKNLLLKNSLLQFLRLHCKHPNTLYSVYCTNCDPAPILGSKEGFRVQHRSTCIYRNSLKISSQEIQCNI